MIADAARSMPHTLRSLEATDEITAELTVLVGFDQDLAAEAIRTSNRIRGLLTQFHPSLERVLGPRLDHQAVTWRLERYGSPAALRKAGRRKLVEVIRPKAPRMATRLIDDVFEALDEQTVVVPGTGTLDIVIPSLARSLGAVHEQRRATEAQISTLLEAHPLSKVLTSIPGVAVRTAATLLVTVCDGTSFPIASYAGLAPTTKSSGTSIHGEHAPRGGNRQLKRAMFLSVFAALPDPASRTYYDRCRARGKTHTQALLRLARQRINVLFAMLRDGTFYEPRTPNPTPRLTKDIEAPQTPASSSLIPSAGHAYRLRRCSRVVSISLRKLLARVPVCDVYAHIEDSRSTRRTQPCPTDLRLSASAALSGSWTR